MIFFIPSRILKLTLDTDLKEDTPSIPVFFCFWMHYYYTYYHISRGVYHFHSRVFCHIWDGSCKTHFWTPRKWSRLRLDHFLGVQKCVLQLPSHTLILTLDTDLEKDTPIIPVFFCLWIQFPPHRKCSTKTITNIKYQFFLLINHFSRPHWRLSSLFLIITFQNMFPF